MKFFRVILHADREKTFLHELRTVICAILIVSFILAPTSQAFATQVPWERTTAPTKDNPYYYDNSYNPFSSKGMNCTWYAWGRAYEVLGVRPSGLSTGHARDWYNNSSYDKGSVPKAGAIACWNATSSNSLGHVAFVEWTDGTNLRVSNSAFQAYEFLVENKTIYSISREAGFAGYLYLFHDVYFSANGGSGAPASQSKKWGSALSVPSTVPTRSGYTFQYWSDKSDGSGAQVHPGDQWWCDDRDITLYAIWKVNGGSLDVSGLLDGANADNISGYGTFDIRVGSTTLTKQTDYKNSSLSAGTTYTISNIKAATGKIYNGVSSGSLSGTVQAGSAISVRLKFDTCTNHSYDADVVTTAATCTKVGVQTFTCTKCGSTRTEPIPKLAHTPVTDPAVPATVLSTGLTEGSHCSVCGTVLVAQEVTPRLPRVLYDFDLDGNAEPVMALPGNLASVEASAFEGSDAKVVIVPDGVSAIGSRAFANMKQLQVVFLPESVRTISIDVFDESPNVKLYVQKGSRWGVRLDLPSVELETGWVAEDSVPAGAVIAEERWTYDYVVAGSVETKTSTTPITEEGWTLSKTDLEQTSTAAQQYVDSYPSGYYGSKDFTTSKWTAYENDTTKRTVTSSIVSSYIYWHWTYSSGTLPNNNYNVFISDIPYETDAKGRYYQYFTSFGSTENAGHTDPNGANGGDCFYLWRGIPADGSWWWFRFPVYQQTRVDYQKVYTYTKTTAPVNETRVSYSPVTESDTVKNVKYEVRYRFA